MLKRLRSIRLKWTVAALYAAAMIFVGFSHVSIARSGAAAIDLAAYALPDGTFGDLCLTDRQDEHGTTSGKHCDACRLTAALGLGPATHTILLDVLTPAERIGPDAGWFYPGVTAPDNVRARAPPLQA